MPLGYDNPGPEPDNVAQVIAAALRRTLLDPQSARGFQLCHAHVLPATPALGPNIPWEPSYRVRFFVVSAKNRFGAYTGDRVGVVRIQNGKLVDLYMTDNPPINGSAVPGKEPCNAIPNDKFSEMMLSVP